MRESRRSNAIRREDEGKDVAKFQSRVHVAWPSSGSTGFACAARSSPRRLPTASHDVTTSPEHYPSCGPTVVDSRVGGRTTALAPAPSNVSVVCSGPSPGMHPTQFRRTSPPAREADVMNARLAGQNLSALLLVAERVWFPSTPIRKNEWLSTATSAAGSASESTDEGTGP